MAVVIAAAPRRVRRDIRDRVGADVDGTGVGSTVGDRIGAAGVEPAAGVHVHRLSLGQGGTPAACQQQQDQEPLPPHAHRITARLRGGRRSCMD